MLRLLSSYDLTTSHQENKLVKMFCRLVRCSKFSLPNWSIHHLYVRSTVLYICWPFSHNIYNNLKEDQLKGFKFWTHREEKESNLPMMLKTQFVELLWESRHLIILSPGCFSTGRRPAVLVAWIYISFQTTKQLKYEALLESVSLVCARIFYGQRNGWASQICPSVRRRPFLLIVNNI